MVRASRKQEEELLIELVRQQKCRTVRDSEHTIPVYGMDINTIDYSRKWLYDAILEKERKNGSNADAEMVRIQANKMVLWVSPKDLKALQTA